MFPHMTNAGYRRGCKCEGCKKAHAENVRLDFLKNHPEPRKPYRKHGCDVNHADFPHGENAGYVAGCRCDLCITTHRTHFRNYSRSYRAPGTPGFKLKAASNAVYRKSQKGLASARKGNATRAARKRGAVIGVSRDEQALVRLIYANCPDGYEVDHIVPLSCGGMHVPANLQYLPRSVNRQKCARTDYDCGAHVISWQHVLEGAFNDHPARE